MIWLVASLCVIIYFMGLYIYNLKKSISENNTKGENKVNQSVLAWFIAWVNSLLARKGYNVNKIEAPSGVTLTNEKEVENGLDIKKVYSDIKKVYKNNNNINNSYICDTEDVRDDLDKPVNVLENPDVGIKKAATLFDIIGDGKIVQNIDSNNIDQTLQAMSEEDNDNDDYTDEIGVNFYYV